MANAQARQEREAEARAADLAAKKGATMRRMMVSQLYCPDKVHPEEFNAVHLFMENWTRLLLISLVNNALVHSLTSLLTRVEVLNPLAIKTS